MWFHTSLSTCSQYHPLIFPPPCPGEYLSAHSLCIQLAFNLILTADWQTAVLFGGDTNLANMLLHGKATAPRWVCTSMHTNTHRCPYIVDITDVAVNITRMMKWNSGNKQASKYTENVIIRRRYMTKVKTNTCSNTYLELFKFFLIEICS